MKLTIEIDTETANQLIEHYETQTLQEAIEAHVADFRDMMAFQREVDRLGEIALRDYWERNHATDD